MPSKNFSLLILCALFTRTGFSQDLSRSSFKVKVKLELYPQFNLNSDVSVINLLKTKGIYVDEKSSITIHEEKNKIDLRCFDCLVRELNSYEAHGASYNERTTIQY